MVSSTIAPVHHLLHGIALALSLLQGKMVRCVRSKGANYSSIFTSIALGFAAPLVFRKLMFSTPSLKLAFTFS